MSDTIWGDGVKIPEPLLAAKGQDPLGYDMTPLPVPKVILRTKPDSEIWMELMVGVLAGGRWSDVDYTAQKADEALAEYKKRFP